MQFYTPYLCSLLFKRLEYFLEKASFPTKLLRSIVSFETFSFPNSRRRKLQKSSDLSGLERYPGIFIQKCIVFIVSTLPNDIKVHYKRRLGTRRRVLGDFFTRRHEGTLGTHKDSSPSNGSPHTDFSHISASYS